MTVCHPVTGRFIPPNIDLKNQSEEGCLYFFLSLRSTRRDVDVITYENLFALLGLLVSIIRIFVDIYLYNKKK